MKELLTVSMFTAKDMLKRKSFIISNIIILLLVVLAFNVPNIIKMISGDDTTEGTSMIIIDKDNVFENALTTLNDLELGYEFKVSNEDIGFEEIKEKFENEEAEEALVIRKENGIIKMEYIVENLVFVEKVPEDLISSLSTLYTNLQISKLNLTQEELMSITPNFEFTLTQTEEKEVEGNPFAIMLLSLVLFYAIYFCAYQVSSSITTEKTSKIIETLVTSTKPSTIVLRKDNWDWNSWINTNTCNYNCSSYK